MKKIYTYQHTHWDYEWYFTENESLIQLIYHMDDVIKYLNENPLESYLLDGQIAIIEDYLKYDMSKYDEFIRLVKEKRLIIGPWYTQTDELIVQGESIVKNLFIGMKQATVYGNVMKVGYLPDSFGQAKNMPKIYKGFGINYSLFWRGVADYQIDKREFIWRSGNDQVLVYNIKNGYFFGSEALEKNISQDDVEHMISDKSSINMIILPMGSDQRKVMFDYPKVIEKFNTDSNNYSYCSMNLEKAFEELANYTELLDTIEDEFINGSDSKIHRSIYSSRYDHKYLSDKIERRLIHTLEPLNALLFHNNVLFKPELIENIWKILLRCFAHDSAGGCNSDKTNKIIMTRLEKADQLSYSLLDYLIRRYAENNSNVKKNALIVVNTTPIYHKQSIKKLLINTKFKNFDLFVKGQKIDYKIIAKKRVYSGVFDNDDSNYLDDLYYYQTEVFVILEIPIYQSVIIDVIESDSTTSEVLLKDDNYIKNQFFKIEFVQNKFNLVLKKSNKYIDDFIAFYDQADDGDTYDFSPLINDEEKKVNFEVISYEKYDYDFKQKMIVKAKIMLPETSLDKFSKTIENDVTISITLGLDEFIDFKIEFDNKCKDHRLRVMIKALDNSFESFADTAFGLIRRSNQHPYINDWLERGFKEEPTSIYPMLNTCGIEGQFETAAITKGIKEYQIVDDNKIMLTLFRSVGFLGKPNLVRRPGAPSGNQFLKTPTPDSQMLKMMKFKFKVYYGNKRKDSQKMIDILSNAVYLPYAQNQNINRFTYTLKYFNNNDIEIDDRMLFNQLDLNGTVITSLVRNDEKTIAVRILNPTDQQIENVKFSLHCLKSAYLTNMLFEIIDELKVYENTVTINMIEKNEILTILLEL